MATDREREALTRAAEAFASPRSTERECGPAGDPPENDALLVEVTIGDWWRLCVALGRMDTAYLSQLHVAARPTPEFIASLASPSPTGGEPRRCRYDCDERNRVSCGMGLELPCPDCVSAPAAPTGGERAREWTLKLLRLPPLPGIDGGRVQIVASDGPRPAENEAVRVREPSAPTEARDGVALIAAERARQVEQEGFTAERDADYGGGELNFAAQAYCQEALEPGTWPRVGSSDGHLPPPTWPWPAGWWKPSGAIRDLAKAGALVAAEIDRIQRAEVLSETDR